MLPINVAVMLASSSAVRTIFEAILKNRSAIFKDLMAVVGKSTGDDQESRREVEAAVSLLKEADLIKERPAAIEDFSSYYVTANGLAAESDLNSIARSSL